MASIDESFTDDDSDDRYISTNALDGICHESQIHPELNKIYARLKIHDRIRKTKNERKGEQISENSMGKGLYKVFKDVVRRGPSKDIPFFYRGSNLSEIQCCKSSISTDYTLIFIFKIFTIKFSL